MSVDAAVTRGAKVFSGAFGLAGVGIGSLTFAGLLIGLADDVECSVLLVERKHERSLFERIFGLGL